MALRNTGYGCPGRTATIPGLRAGGLTTANGYDVGVWCGGHTFLISVSGRGDGDSHDEEFGDAAELLHTTRDCVEGSLPENLEVSGTTRRSVSLRWDIRRKMYGSWVATWRPDIDRWAHWVYGR